MRGFLLSTACICCFLIPSKDLLGAQDFALQGRLARWGAWGATTLLFAGGLLGTEQAVKDTIAYLTAKLPFGSVIAESQVPRIVGWTVALPLMGYLYISYHEFIWYFTYIICSGKQASPILAREIARHLNSYVQCMKVIRETHSELNKLLADAEACVDTVGAKEALRRVGASVDTLFVQELTRADEYVAQARTRIARLGLGHANENRTHDAETSMRRLDLRRVSIVEPDFSKADVDILEGLVKDMLTYWHDYLTSLAAAINKRILLCQKVDVIEKFIALVLNRPLFPAFEQTSLPEPNIGTPELKHV
ncbi:MAG: hypothetical protein M1549_02240 [Candidatus Dependentiae bacterium]|nr:hypothetical protein [Candidatus Dependentiae bacterium]